MSDKPKFIKSRNAFKVKDNYFVKYNGELIDLEEIETITENFKIVKGEVIVNPDVQPAENIEPKNNIQSFKNNNLKLPNNAQDLDEQIRTAIFSQDFKAFKKKVNALEKQKRINTTKKYNYLIQYLVVHPDQTPVSKTPILKKFKGKSTINPLNPSTKIPIDGPTFRRLLKVYEYDENKNKLIKKTEPDHYYDFEFMKVKKLNAANRKKINDNPNQLLIDNVLTKTQRTRPSRALLGDMYHFQVNFDIPIGIRDYDTNTLYQMIEQQLDDIFKLDKNFTLFLTMNMIGTNPKTNEWFPYQNALATLTYMNDKNDFENSIKNEINRIIEEYQDQNSNLRKLHSIEFKVIIHNPIVPEGGCNLDTILKNIQTTNYFKYSDFYLKSIRSTHNNCLPVLLLSLQRKHQQIKKTFTMPIKNDLSNKLREKLEITPNSLISADKLPDFARNLAINIDYFDLEKNQIINEYSYHNNDHQMRILLTVLHNHYFEIVKNDHPEFKSAQKYAKELDFELLKTIQTEYSDENIQVEQVERSGDFQLPKKYQSPHLELNYQSVGYLKIKDNHKTHFWYQENYQMFNNIEQFIDFLTENQTNLKYIITFGGSRYDYFYLMNIIKTKCFNALDHNNTCYFKKQFFRLGFLGIECTDLQFFISNDSFDLVCQNLLKDQALNNKITMNYLINLQTIFEQYNHHTWQEYGYNTVSFYTMSSMAQTIMLKYLNPDHIINHPNPDQYKFLIDAKFGARTYPLQTKFQTKFSITENMSAKEIQRFIDSGDYLHLIDSDSEYPYVMYNYKYPTGKAKLINRGFWMKYPLNIGIYHVEFIPPTNIRIPILLKHQDGIGHDLLPGSGTYIHSEINHAFELGYQIKVVKSLTWEDSDYIFRHFVSEIYPKKYQYTNNPIARQLVKDLLNKSFGKLIQKIGNYKHNFIKTSNEFLNFAKTHRTKDCVDFPDGTVLVSGKEITEEITRKQINRPYHLGVFILGYARTHMLDIMRTISPTLKKCPFYYHATDSFAVTHRAFTKLEKNGQIWSESDNILKTCLGKFNNEKDGRGGRIGPIIEAQFLNVNKYHFKYLDLKSGKIEKSIRYSGANREFVTFDTLTQDKLTFTFNKTTRQDAKKNFVIIHNKSEKTMTNNPWTGMNLIDNEWYPIGYKSH